MTLKRIAELLYATMKELDARFSGEAKARELFQALEQNLILTEDERSGTDSSSTPRWKTNVQFYTIGCVKAGYLLKNDGRWVLTDSGRKALISHNAEQFYIEIKRQYDIWAESRRVGSTMPAEIADVAGTALAEREVNVDQAKELARSEIERYLNEFDGATFQNLVAELLKAEGYKIKFNSAGKGADGGIDIIAYKDSLGFERIVVEVKHKDGKATPKDIAYLSNNITGEGAIGLFVSSGGFTKQALDTAKHSPKHLELMDLDDFLEQWQAHFLSVSRKGQEMLPIVPVYFLEPKLEF